MIDYPYSNFHQLNLDWILGVVKKYDDYMTDNFKSALDNYLNQFFVNAFMECLYVPETETIKLSFQQGSGDSLHTYSDNTLFITARTKED